MTISLGQKLPDITLKIFDGEEKLKDVSTAEIFGKQRVLMFGVPGAFSPSCNNEHLPGYLERVDDFKSIGIDRMVCLGVNDPFVMKAWGDKFHVDDRILMLADGNAAFTRAMGMELDATGLCLGTRTQRFAMVIEDCVVSELQVEQEFTEVTQSAAVNMLNRLKARQAA